MTMTSMPDDEQTYFDKERDRLSAEIASVRNQILFHLTQINASLGLRAPPDGIQPPQPQGGGSPRHDQGI